MKVWGVLLFFYAGSCVAQSLAVDQAVDFVNEQFPRNNLSGDQASYQEQAGEENLESRLLEYELKPLKINMASFLDLLDFPLFSKNQVRHVLTYRKRYGHFRSMKEMALLPQFSDELIQVLFPFIDFSGSVDLKKRMKIHFLATTKLRVQKDSVATGFKSNANYEAVKLSVKDFKPGFSLGFNAERDQGELWFDPQKGIEHLHYYLSYSDDHSLLSNLVIGTYRASLGHGLVIHTGFNNYKSQFLNGGLSFSKQKYKAQSSNEESSFLRGLGTTFVLKYLKVSVFYSNNQLDATAYSDSLGDYFKAVSYSGMHRTAAEIDKKDRVTAIDFGGHLGYERKRFNLSWNHLFTKLSMPLRRKENYYNLYYLTGDEFYTQSLDFNLVTTRIHLFGELALDQQLDLALLTGVSGTLGELINYNVLFRHYKHQFQSFRGQSYQQSSQLRNERGLVIELNGKFGNGFSYRLVNDAYMFPRMSYRKRFSAWGNERFGVVIFNDGKGFESRAKLKLKEGQESKLVEEVFEIQDKERFSFSLNYRSWLNEQVRIAGQFEYVRAAQKDQFSEGALFFQEIKFKIGGTSFGPRLTLFSIDDYDARIYIYEPSLRNSSPFLFFKDTGFSFSGKISHEIDDFFSFSTKLYYTWKQGQADAIKSGVNFQVLIKY